MRLTGGPWDGREVDVGMGVRVLVIPFIPSGDQMADVWRVVCIGSYVGFGEVRYVDGVYEGSFVLVECCRDQVVSYLGHWRGCHDLGPEQRAGYTHRPPDSLRAMDRPTFERLRDLPDKAIHGEIRLVARRQTSPALVADNIAIENSAGVDLRLNVSYNPEVGSKTFNVIEVGNGPICRLDVDGTVHAPAGRSHKHSLQTDRCPASNLPNGVVARPDLAGQSPAEVFAAFREMAGIAFDGTFVVPEAP